MGQIKIRRLTEWANRRFSYKIFVDGDELFEIANGQEKCVSFDKGATVQAKLLWCGSKTVNLSVDNGQIKELIVKANNGPNIIFPFFALTILILCGVVNIIYPENGAKVYMTSIMVGIIIYALCLLTIWRNKFLDIKLVTD